MSMMHSRSGCATCLIVLYQLCEGHASAAVKQVSPESTRHNRTCGIGMLQAGSAMSHFQTEEERAVEASACSQADVRRRRRNIDMCTCRRRSTTEGLDVGWKCVGTSIVKDSSSREPAPSCSLPDVRRRRRASACSCRRRDSRDGSLDLPTGYSCVGDTISATPALVPVPISATPAPVPVSGGSPSAGTPAPVPTVEVDSSSMHFLVIGDAGTRSARQREVAGALAQVAGSTQPMFIAHIGDNIYGDGAEGDPGLIAAYWRDVYVTPHDALRRPWFVITGNHDWHTDARTERDFTNHDLNVGGWWHMPHFWYRRHFQLPTGVSLDAFFIDTQIWKGSSLAEAHLGDRVKQDQEAWLRTELAASIAEWKVVIGHHPVYSAGSHGTTEDLLLELDPLLRAHGVQVYFNGHDHNKQLITHRGLHYVTSGAGGKSSGSRSHEEPAGSLRHIFQDSGFVGFAISSASEAALTFYSQTGEIQAVEVIANTAPELGGPSLLQRSSGLHCHGRVLKDVDRACSPDGCKVVADQLTNLTCRDFCSANALSCSDGWEEEDEGCKGTLRLGCNGVRASQGNHICLCAEM